MWGEKQGIRCFDDHNVDSVRMEHISTKAENIGSGNCDKMQRTIARKSVVVTTYYESENDNHYWANWQENLYCRSCLWLDYQRWQFLATDDAECEQLLDLISTVLASGQRMKANPLVEGIRRKTFCINVFKMLSWIHWCMKVWQDRVWQG